MFDIFCPACASRRLIFAGQVQRIRNDVAGIHVDFQCWCGAAGTWTTGRRSSVPTAQLARAS